MQSVSNKEKWIQMKERVILILIIKYLIIIINAFLNYALLNIENMIS